VLCGDSAGSNHAQVQHNLGADLTMYGL